MRDPPRDVAGSFPDTDIADMGIKKPNECEQKFKQYCIWKMDLHSLSPFWLFEILWTGMVQYNDSQLEKMITKEEEFF